MLSDIDRSTKTKSQDAREGRPDQSVVAPLDPSLLVIEDRDREFLHTAISSNDEELRARIFQIQKKSYGIFPYPCILSFHFIVGKMSMHPAYPKILLASRDQNTVLLDLGCCMGTDVRKLVYDGYPASNVLGSDLRRSFIDDGYELYRDIDTCKIRFFTSDVFAVSTRPGIMSNDVPLSQVTALGELQDRVTHLYIALVFHLFDEVSQYEMAIRAASLLKRESGANIFGRHQGADSPTLIKDKFFRGRFIHSPESWKNLWIKVFTELEGVEFAETRVIVDAFLKPQSFEYGVLVGRTMVWSIHII